MFQVLCDCFLHPRNIIEHRQKSGFFVFCYVFLLTLMTTVGVIISCAKFTGMEYPVKLKLIRQIDSFSSRVQIVDGVLYTDDIHVLAMRDISVYLVPEDTKVAAEESWYFIVTGDKVKFYVRNNLIVEKTLLDLSPNYRNVDFLEVSISSINTNPLFAGIQDVVNNYKWYVGWIFIFLTIFSSLLYWTLYVVIGYLFMVIGGIKKYIKASELIKILYLSGSSFILVIIVNNLFNFDVTILYLLFMFACIPFYVVHHEIIKRIRLYHINLQMQNELKQGNMDEDNSNTKNND